MKALILNVLLIITWIIHSTTAQTTTTVDCFDSDSQQCPYYAQNNYCKSYYTIGGISITELCRKSCQICNAFRTTTTATTTQPSSECVDTDTVYCPYYASVGYCKNYFTINGMLLTNYCARSCNSCILTTTATVASTTTQYTTSKIIITTTPMPITTVILNTTSIPATTILITTTTAPIVITTTEIPSTTTTTDVPSTITTSTEIASTTTEIPSTTTEVPSVFLLVYRNRLLHFRIII